MKINKILEFLCWHRKCHEEFCFQAKYISKSSKKLTPVKRYDIYKKRVCSKCGKLFYKEKYKSNLNENQIKIYH